MIITRTGDLMQDESEAIVNTVNCVGVMGRGIALQFKNAYPDNFKEYAKACKEGEVVPGKMLVHETDQFRPRYVINFPTKRHWRGKSRLEDIDSGLVDLVNLVRGLKIRSIALPPLGSGLGGLSWPDVKHRIEDAFSPLEDVEIVLYEPAGAPAAKEMVRNQEVPNMTAGRAALVELVHRYLAGLLDPFVTLLEVHKLMYFLQEAGEPLRLRYQKAPFGPFADNLGHVLKRIEGHLVSGYADGGDAPDKQLTLVPGAYDDATAFLKDNRETRERFERVSELVAGFETPPGLELLASVHWLAKHEAVADEESLIAAMYSWNQRKERFTPRQIGIAARVLSSQGWIGSKQLVAE